MKPDQRDFIDRVRSLVMLIPVGKVTTYGDIARALGIRKSARLVGWALGKLVDEHPLEVPCHRVVNAQGLLSGRHAFPGNTMAERLEQEGIPFKNSNQIDLSHVHWTYES